MLRDLTVQNYRCFEDFHIDGLEQVNLFVGNNNSGKTSLLEAIYLFASLHTKKALFEIIRNRIDYFNNINYSFNYAAKELFNQRKIDIPIIINSEDAQEQRISIFQKNYDLICLQGDNERTNRILQKNAYMENSIAYGQQDFVLNLINRDSLKIANTEDSNTFTLNQKDTESTLFISVSKINFNKIAFMWDTISLTQKEDKVIEALQIIEPSIKRIGFASSQKTESIRIKVKGQDYPIPLSSMGEGIYRILTLAISLVTAENGVLLVDEIETGLHYEAQTDMWRLIIETAKELNVQVFATTHSWDCIAAFQEALSQVEDKSLGKLFRLDSKYGKPRAVEYNAEDLDIAVRESIEVR